MRPSSALLAPLRIAAQPLICQECGAAAPRNDPPSSLWRWESARTVTQSCPIYQYGAVFHCPNAMSCCACTAGSWHRHLDVSRSADRLNAGIERAQRRRSLHPLRPRQAAEFRAEPPERFDVHDRASSQTLRQPRAHHCLQNKAETMLFPGMAKIFRPDSESASTRHLPHQQQRLAHLECEFSCLSCVVFLPNGMAG